VEARARVRGWVESLLNIADKEKYVHDKGVDDTTDENQLKRSAVKTEQVL
jgi:hypothetical protein